MASLDVTSFILGSITAGGGIYGYARTRSVPSIVAGCTIGALYALGGYRIQGGEPYGVEISLLASVVLAGSSVPRALRARKPISVGLSLLSVFGLVIFGDGLMRGVA